MFDDPHLLTVGPVWFLQTKVTTFKASAASWKRSYANLNFLEYPKHIGMSPSHPTKGGHFSTGHKDNNIAKIWGFFGAQKRRGVNKPHCRHQAVPGNT